MLMLNTEIYSILVRVPPPEPIVFIAMPFSNEFDDVKTAIDKAVNGIIFAKLRTQMTSMPESPRFIYDISAMTRKARLIVAVCSPDKDTGVPNPNVMYEVGLAQSIGKGVVILTCDIKSLPANMRDQNVFTYDPKTVTKDEVVLALRDHIHLVLARISNDLTDSAYKDVSVVHARNWMATTPDLLEKVLVILSFAKQVHNLYQELDTGHLDHINKRLGDLVRGTERGSALEEKRIEFGDLWTLYFHKHQQTSVGSFSRQASEVKAVFDSLQSDDTVRNLFAASKTFFHALTDAIEAYQRSHDKVARHAESGIGTLLKSASLSDFRSEVAELSRNMKSILVYADRLMLNLIGVIVEERSLS